LDLHFAVADCDRGIAGDGLRNTLGEKTSDFGRNILHHVISSSSSFSSSNFGGPDRWTSVRDRYVFCWVKIVFNSLNFYSIDNLVMVAQPTSSVLSCTPNHPNGSDNVVWENLLEGLWGHILGLLDPLSDRRVF
jgi:hypothetical protein